MPISTYEQCTNHWPLITSNGTLQQTTSHSLHLVVRYNEPLVTSNGTLQQTSSNSLHLIVRYNTPLATRYI